MINMTLIKPIDITNAGLLLFMLASLIDVQTRISQTAIWIKFLFVVGIFLFVTGTLIHAFDWSRRLTGHFSDKKVSVQKLLQDEGIRYFQVPKDRPYKAKVAELLKVEGVEFVS